MAKTALASEVAKARGALTQLNWEKVESQTVKQPISGET